MPEERKLVTVLFADVSGSTTLGDELDPEDVRSLMARYYEHARRIIADHSGTLEKFIGDAVMAVFGLPYAHGDDAERAIAAALALHRAVLNDEVLEDITIRVGVNTGEVVTTSDRTAGDFLVTGDAVNVAARLQQTANPGEIVVSERTYAATGAVFLFGDLREVEVKGKSHPLRVFTVKGVREVRETIRPPMVGREDDLTMLSLLHRRTLREGRPQLVSIVAPAGTGKTRLLEEFLAKIDMESVQVATSRCLPYGQNLTYWPLRGLLEELLGGVDRRQIGDVFAAGGYEPDDAARLADLILLTLGVEGDEAGEQERIFNAWRLLIEALAQRSPRIVIFEDLHWASDSLLDLVEHVMHPRTRAPLLLIAISRPELLDRRPTWGGGRQLNFTSLVLEPLDEKQAKELVQLMAGDLPESLCRRIVERSGGNPFFVTEMVRGLAERGIGAEPEGGDAVPDTVHAAVLARLDQLYSHERRVLQAAAVGGRLFRPAIVQAVLDDLDSQDLELAIEALLARDLIVPDEGGAFTFRHILIRDVAYGTLSRSERIRMHGAVADWLAGFAAERIDEYAELIAYHYGEAIALSRQSRVPLPLPFDTLTAMNLLVRAGEAASRAGAIVEARRHLQSALALAPDGDRGRLLEKLGDCAVFGSGVREAYEEALEHWRSDPGGDPRIGARLLRKLLILHLRWSVPLPFQSDPSYEAITRMADEAERLCREAGDEDERWRVQVARLFCYRLLDPSELGKAEKEREMCLAAASYFEEREDWESLSAALDAYMGHCATVGLHEAVVQAGEKRLHIPRLSTIERADALQMVTTALHNLAEYDQCIALVRGALAEKRPDEPLTAIGTALSMAMNACWLSGRWSDIPQFMAIGEEAREQFQDDVARVILTEAYMCSLQLAMARDDFPTADAAVSTLYRMHPTTKFPVRATAALFRYEDPKKVTLDPASIPFAFAATGALKFFIERGMDPPQDWLDASIRYAQTSSVDVLVRCVETALALVSRDSTRLAAAIEQAEQHHLIPHAARMRIVLAQLTGDPAPLNQAQAVLERLEDRQFLRRLEEVRASL